MLLPPPPAFEAAGGGAGGGEFLPGRWEQGMKRVCKFSNVAVGAYQACLNQPKDKVSKPLALHTVKEPCVVSCCEFQQSGPVPNGSIHVHHFQLKLIFVYNDTRCCLSLSTSTFPKLPNEVTAETGSGYSSASYKSKLYAQAND